MSRQGLWGIAAAAAMIAAPGARADDRNAQHGSSSTSSATTPSGTSTGAGDTSATSRDAASSSSSTATQGSEVRTSSDSKKTASAHDNGDVIKNLYGENVFEIESAKIAEKNAQSQDVKDFAKQIQKDHEGIKDSLAKLAKDRNLKLDDDQAKKEHQAHLDKMKSLKGADMDRHFASMMVSGHEKDLSEVSQALSQARQSGDNELASVLESAKTKMQAHHEVAQGLEHGRGQQRMGRRGSSDRTAPSSDTGSTSGTMGAPSSTSETSPSSTGSSGGMGTTGSTSGTSSGTEPSQGSGTSSTTK